MRIARWNCVVLRFLVALAPAAATGQCVNIAGVWNATETGSITLALTASDGESATETDAVNGSGAVTITQTATCIFQYSPLLSSGKSLLNSNLTASQIAQLVRTITVSGNNVSESGLFAILNRVRNYITRNGDACLLQRLAYKD